ncbi:MAG: MBL fold metallo-hydrolase [Candidatus Bathyarchaeota archaeon]|nr:MAG: MBL fold metallo-hydrolase [Candidatus Bathyarchaeota archaeon]
MFFKQIKHVGDNFSYIIADETSKEAAVVDPSFNATAIIQFANKQNFRIKYIINTHHHRDHTEGNERIKSTLNSKIVAHKQSRNAKDIAVDEGEILKVGGISVKVLHTPGHTPDSNCLLIDRKLLTGDTLFIGECGRTDISGGNSKDMYYSLNKLKKLDDDIKIYPGHDYGVKPHSTIGEEKQTNYTLEKRSLKEFIEFMKE